MSEEERIKLISKCKDIDCICQDCMYLEFVKNNILNPIQQENQELKRQLEYLRSGEYLNQLKYERNLLESIVQDYEIPKEDKEFIDMTHRNTELLEENEKFKKRIEEDKEDISVLMDIINKNCSELKCTSDEWLVIKLWQDRLGGDVDDE